MEGVFVKAGVGRRREGYLTSPELTVDITVQITDVTCCTAVEQTCLRQLKGVTDGNVNPFPTPKIVPV